MELTEGRKDSTERILFTLKIRAYEHTEACNTLPKLKSLSTNILQ